jgi:glutathione S-transferase
MTTARPAQPIQLHRHPLSGHAHRVQLFLSLLGLPTTLIDVDLMKGAHKKPDFLALNAFGQVPVIDDGGTIVPDSNAILVYLASKYGEGNWLPVDPVGAAAVQRWLSVAAGQIAFGPAAARLVTVFGAKLDAAEVISRAHATLRIMNAVLDRATFLAGDHPTIADVACYTYVAHAPEGNVALDEYPNVKRWLARIEGLPGFVPMQATKAGLVA